MWRALPLTWSIYLDNLLPYFRNPAQASCKYPSRCTTRLSVFLQSIWLETSCITYFVRSRGDDPGAKRGSETKGWWDRISGRYPELSEYILSPDVEVLSSRPTQDPERAPLNNQSTSGYTAMLRPLFFQQGDYLWNRKRNCKRRTSEKKRDTR